LNGGFPTFPLQAVPAAGIDPEKYKIMSFSIAEEEIRQIGLNSQLHLRRLELLHGA